MRKYYWSIYIGFVFSLLLGCQWAKTEHLNLNPFVAATSDSTLTDSVRAALMNDNDLSRMNLDVETHQGAVTLRGYVKTIRQSDNAADIAQKVEGVKAVENEIIVRK